MQFETSVAPRPPNAVLVHPGCQDRAEGTKNLSYNTQTSNSNVVHPSPVDPQPSLKPVFDPSSYFQARQQTASSIPCHRLKKPLYSRDANHPICLETRKSPYLSCVFIPHFLHLEEMVPSPPFGVDGGKPFGPYVLESLVDDFIEADRPDYGYLFDGTFRNADLPRGRLLLQQALRVQILPTEDLMKILIAALKDPGIAARVRSLDDLVESLVMPEMGYPSAVVGGGDDLPVEAPQGTPACEVTMVGAA